MPDNIPNNNSEKKYRIVLIKNPGKAFTEVKEILEASQESLKVEILFVSSSEYLEYLQQKTSIPPAFVICFTDSESNYKNIFIKVKEGFPETRRMLIVESSERDKVIDSLNKDEIHFCLALPLKDSDLLEHIKLGLKDVEQGNTWEYTKRIVDEQNVKMYKIAKSFKEKEVQYQRIINQKEVEYKSLKADHAKSQDTACESSSLGEYITVKNISMIADDFTLEFKALAGVIAKIFNEIASKNSIDFEKGKYSDILKTKDQPLSDNKDKARMINHLLSYAFTDSTPDSPLDSNEAIEPDEDVEMTEIKRPVEQVDSGMLGIDSEDLMAQLEQALEFQIDDKRLRVQVQIKDKYSEILTVENIFDYLREIGVSYGLTNEQTLVTWLENQGAVEQLIVAQGTPSVQPVDGSVKYHFNTDFIHAGKVKSDGSIDFRERGNIPFVEENTLLAEKKPAKFGTSGVDISGAQISVDDPIDPVFEAGDNTFESEGGMKIFAQTGGQPHLDAMGIVSVAPVLNIDSNVDYETGNISFQGSIIVNGAIKEGFKVEGTNLTVEQIEGAEVNITGDLNVSAGIIDSNILAQGNIQAKYINNAKIETFGDLIVTTEVLDSKVTLTGKFDGGTARIIGSEIIAKGGVEAGQIGTIGSKSVRLRVGVDDYIAKLVQKIDYQLEETKEEIDIIKKQIDDLNKKDEECFKIVSESAHVQDRTQIQMKQFKEKISELEESGHAAELQTIKAELKKLETKAVDAEIEVGEALDNQDKIAGEIQVKESEIEKIEEKNIGYVNEKKALKECSEKGKIKAKVIVNQKIMSGSKIESAHSQLTIRDDTSRCHIEEIGMGSGSAIQYYEMQLINL